MKARIIALVFFLMTGVELTAQSKHASQTMYPSYEKLILAGYQGWFHNDRADSAFTDMNQVRIDMWPDVSEYEKTYPTGLKHADGSTAMFFSPNDKSTVDVHFKWMKQYGLDGVFMQRFFGYTKPGKRRELLTEVLEHSLEASSKYERAIALMYDLSGLRPGGNINPVIEDWKFLVDSLQITNQKGTKTYLHHNGKPVVAIWGIGFPDRPYNIRNIQIEKLINFLKSDPVYGGCTVMIGIPTYWRELGSDCIDDPYLHEVIKMADIIMPWMVGRFDYDNKDEYREVLKGDMKWAKKNNIEYVPCVYPGFSWHNLSMRASSIEPSPLGRLPRRGGEFFWQQISNALDCNARMFYVAMYDEVNESTAIFKCTDNPPVSDEAKFIDMDGKPSDHYLWLTGEAGRMLRGEKPVSLDLPKRE